MLAVRTGGGRLQTLHNDDCALSKRLERLESNFEFHSFVAKVISRQGPPSVHTGVYAHRSNTACGGIQVVVVIGGLFEERARCAEGFAIWSGDIRAICKDSFWSKHTERTV